MLAPLAFCDLKKKIRVFYKLILFFPLTIVACLGEPLKGGIQYSEKLAPLSQSLQSGVSFDEAKVMQSRSDDWIEIPKWLGGNWVNMSTIRLSTYDIASEKLDQQPVSETHNMREVIGLQADARGKFWTPRYPFKPIVFPASSDAKSSLTVEKNEQITTSIFREYSQGIFSGDKFDMRAKDVKVFVNLTNKSIERVERSETQRSITQLDDGSIAIFVESQIYDDVGLPIKHRKYAEIWVREAPFKVVNEIGQVSVFSSFKKFLQGSARPLLVPLRDKNL